MFHHKLGWQTSDQQDKAVSCEVGVLLVLASVLQAVWGAGSWASALQAFCAVWGLRSPGVGAPPAGMVSHHLQTPTPIAYSEPPLLAPRLDT